jgi:predicted negative regulator of RcsB-dependent stress response
VDRLTRKELKTDKFALEVTHTVEYLGGHRQAVLRYGGAVLAILLIAGGAYYYFRQQRAERQAGLAGALRSYNAQVGPTSNEFIKSFPTQEEKDKAVRKEFTDLTTKYSGSAEATIGNYMLGVVAADKGDIPEAEKNLKLAAGSNESDYGSLAKLALASVYSSEGKAGDAEKLLRDLIANPTLLVSKEQATITLAKLIAPKNLAEAQKLLDPLRTVAGATGQAAINAYSEISPKK